MKILSLIKKHTKRLLVISSIMMVSFNSFAEYTQVSALVTGDNDCANNKYFDDPDPESAQSGFSNCKIFVKDGNETKYLSDVIGKFDTENSLNNSTFTSSGNYTVVEDDWMFSNVSTKDKTGTWVYNENVHTYPDIRFWTAKAGNGFRLFWVIEDNDDDFCVAGNNSSSTTNLNFDCMNLAISVTSGDWITPSNKGLSHLTFFGGLCTGPECIEPPTDIVVSEPTTIAILALGLLGLSVRRKQSIKTKI